MQVIVDTNIVLRYQLGLPAFADIDAVLQEGWARGDEFVVTGQIIAEAYVSWTRPLAANGFGLSALQAFSLLHDVEGFFRVLQEPASAYGEWKRLLTKHQVLGKNAHDARIVASMLSLGINSILTLNPADFARYSEIAVITP